MRTLSLTNQRFAEMTLRQVLPIAAGVAVLALSARAIIPLPFTPVPITAQTLAVLVVGAVLGWRGAAATVAAYLAAGAAGLPMFAAGGGAHLFLGPTGGFLLGMLPAAMLAGWTRQRFAGRTALLIGGFVLADAAIFAMGLLGLAIPLMLAGVPLAKVLALGLVPFLPGELVKLALATLIVRSTTR